MSLRVVDCEEMGRELVDMLMRMLENNLLEIPAMFLPVEIIPGGTTTKRENLLLSPGG